MKCTLFVEHRLESCELNKKHRIPLAFGLIRRKGSKGYQSEHVLARPFEAGGGTVRWLHPAYYLLAIMEVR